MPLREKYLLRFPLGRKLDSNVTKVEEGRSPGFRRSLVKPPQTPQGGLVRLTDFARSRAWPSLRTLRRWTSEGEPPPGFVEAGCVRTIGRAVLIDPVVFDEWAKGKIQTAEKRGKGRPRRVI